MSSHLNMSENTEIINNDITSTDTSNAETRMIHLMLKLVLIHLMLKLILIHLMLKLMIHLMLKLVRYI